MKTTTNEELTNDWIFNTTQKTDAYESFICELRNFSGLSRQLAKEKLSKCFYNDNDGIMWHIDTLEDLFSDYLYLPNQIPQEAKKDQIPQEAKKEVKKWEYQTLQSPSITPPGLEMAGDNGWELVSVVNSFPFIFFFKRPKS